MILREIYIQPYYFRPFEARETVPLNKGAVAQDFHPLFFFLSNRPPHVSLVCSLRQFQNFFYAELKKENHRYLRHR